MKLYDPTELYDEKYCKRINAKQWRFNLIPSTVKVLNDHFKPKSVVDAGCANGLHLRAFKDLGVKTTFGIEGTDYWKPYLEAAKVKHVIRDLRDPLSKTLPNLVKFDLVISFEVLEHLDKEFSGIAVDNLTYLGNTICCSACPISGGFHHFNPQPKKYWIEKFERHGFKYCKDEVDELQSKFKSMNCSDWFKTGLKIFRKDN